MPASTVVVNDTWLFFWIYSVMTPLLVESICIYFVFNRHERWCACALPALPLDENLGMVVHPHFALQVYEQALQERELLDLDGRSSLDRGGKSSSGRSNNTPRGKSTDPMQDR